MLDPAAEQVPDEQLRLLNPRRVVARHHERQVGRFTRRTAVPAQQCCGAHADGMRRPQPAHHAGRDPAGAEGQRQIPGAAQRFDLSREAVLEVAVVGDAGQYGAVGGEGQRGQRTSGAPVAVHELGGEMLCLGRAAAVAEEHQLAAVAQRLRAPDRKPLELLEPLVEHRPYHPPMLVEGAHDLVSEASAHAAPERVGLVFSALAPSSRPGR